MYAAAYNQNPQVITTLLKAGADINARDSCNNMTPLMYAAWLNRNPELIITLLNASADAKAKSSAGKTAFDFAKYNLKLIGTDAYWKLQEASQ
jgi:ankyrin repeat protein